MLATGRRTAARLLWLLPLLSSQPAFAQSATPPRLAAHIAAISTPESLDTGEVASAILELRNTGAETWDAGGPVRLSYRWLSQDGAPVVRDGRRTLLSATVPPGQTLRLCALLEAPPQTGALRLEWDLVKEGDAWFSALDPGSLLRLPVHVRAAAIPRAGADRQPLALWMAVSLFHLLVSAWWSAAAHRMRAPGDSGGIETRIFETTLFAVGTLHGVLFVASLVTGLQAMRGVWWVAAWDVAVALGLAIATRRSRASQGTDNADRRPAMAGPAADALGWTRLCLSAIGAALLLGLAIAWLQLSARSLIVTGSDAAHYHAPHAVRYALGGSPFDLLATPHVYPMGTSLIAAWFLLPLRDPLLIDMPMLLAFALLAAALLRLFRLITGQPGLLWVPWFMLALAAAPLLQAATLFSSDLPFAAGFMAASAQAVACWRRVRLTRRDAVHLGLSFGLLCGVKTTGAAAMALLVAAAAGVSLLQRRGRWRREAANPLAPPGAVARRAGLVTLAVVAWLAGGGLWLVRNEVRYGSPIAPSGLQIAGVTIFSGESFSSASTYFSVADDVAAGRGYRLTRRATYWIDRWLGPVLWPTAALIVLLTVDGIAARRRWRTTPTDHPDTLNPPQRLVLLAAFLLMAAALVWLLTRAPWTSLEWTRGLSLRYALPVIVGLAFCAFLGLFPQSWRWYDRAPLALAGWLLIAGGGLALFLRSRAALPAASLDPVPRLEPMALVAASVMLAVGWIATRSRAARVLTLAAVAFGIWPLSGNLAARNARLVAEAQFEETRRVRCADAGIDLGLDSYAAFYAEVLAREPHRGVSCSTRRMFVNARFDAPLALQSLPYVALVADLHSGELSEAALRDVGRSPCDYLVVTRAELETDRGSTLLQRARAVRAWTAVAERGGYVAFAVIDR